MNRAMEAERLISELNDEDRVLLVFAYLGPLAIVTLVASRKEFVKWHAKQGLLLAFAAAAGYVVLKPIHLLLQGPYLHWLGELFWTLVALTGLGVGVLVLLCVVRALEGERFKVPLLGELADRL
jgi:uncharacterized membrane protein